MLLLPAGSCRRLYSGRIDKLSAQQATILFGGSWGLVGSHWLFVVHSSSLICMAIPAAPTPLQPTGTARPLSPHFTPLISPSTFRRGLRPDHLHFHTRPDRQKRKFTDDIRWLPSYATDVVRMANFCGKLSGIWWKWTKRIRFGG